MQSSVLSTSSLQASQSCKVAQALSRQVQALVVEKQGCNCDICRRRVVWGAFSFDIATNTLHNQTLIPEPCLLQLHPSTGTVLSAIGTNMFAMPHGLHVDWWGHLWVADAGLHQVLKLNKQGAVLWAHGTPFKPGNDTETCCKPTDVATLPNGDAFISDGYCNSRVLVARWAAGVQALPFLHGVT